MGKSTPVGRVGALAVALGTGLAVASGPAVAWADEAGEAASAVDSGPRTVERPTHAQESKDEPAVERRKNRKAHRIDDEPRVAKRRVRVSEPEADATPANDRVEAARASAEPAAIPQVEPPAARVSVSEPVALQVPATTRVAASVPTRTPIVRTVLRAINDAVASGSGHGTQPETPLL